MRKCTNHNIEYTSTACPWCSAEMLARRLDIAKTQLAEQKRIWAGYTPDSVRQAFDGQQARIAELKAQIDCGATEPREACLSANPTCLKCQISDHERLALDACNGVRLLVKRLATTTAALEAVQARELDLLQKGDLLYADNEGLRNELEQEASAHRATTRELEAARLSIEDRERIITRYDAWLKVAHEKIAQQGEAVTELRRIKLGGYPKWLGGAIDAEVRDSNAPVQGRLDDANAILDRLCELAKGVRVEGDEDMVGTFERRERERAALEAVLVDFHHWLLGLAPLCSTFHLAQKSIERRLANAASVGQAVKARAIEVVDTAAARLVASHNASSTAYQFGYADGHTQAGTLIHRLDVAAIIATLNQPRVQSDAEGDDANEPTRNS